MRRPIAEKLHAPAGKRCEIREMDDETDTFWKILERATGIEPVSSAWKAEVLPLHNARSGKPLITRAAHLGKRPNKILRIFAARLSVTSAQHFRIGASQISHQ